MISTLVIKLWRAFLGESWKCSTSFVKRGTWYMLLYLKSRKKNLIFSALYCYNGILCIFLSFWVLQKDSSNFHSEQRINMCIVYTSTLHWKLNRKSYTPPPPSIVYIITGFCCRKFATIDASQKLKLLQYIKWNDVEWKYQVHLIVNVSKLKLPAENHPLTMKQRYIQSKQCINVTLLQISSLPKNKLSNA